MVKQLGILVSFLLLNLTAFSQPGTVTLDFSTAKQVAVDLVKGDSTSAELKATLKLVNTIQAQLTVREREVITLREKSMLYVEQIGAYKQKEIQFALYNEQLKGENLKLKDHVKLLGVAVGVTSVVAIVGIMLR
jgi:hypothetical protein